MFFIVGGFDGCLGRDSVYRDELGLSDISSCSAIKVMNPGVSANIYFQYIYVYIHVYYLTQR